LFVLFSFVTSVTFWWLPFIASYEYKISLSWELQKLRNICLLNKQC